MIVVIIDRMDNNNCTIVVNNTIHATALVVYNVSILVGKPLTVVLAFSYILLASCKKAYCIALAISHSKLYKTCTKATFVNQLITWPWSMMAFNSCVFGIGSKI